jgi:hypothetical protein
MNLIDILTAKPHPIVGARLVVGLSDDEPFIYRKPRRLKTHCKRGHAFVEGNIWYDRGKRVCKTCATAWKLGRFVKQEACNRGHKFTEANTLINGNGKRVCLACREEYNRKRRALHSGRK